MTRSERLGGHEDGRSKTFRDTAVRNLREFFERFRALNVRSNDQMDSLASQCNSLVDLQRVGRPANLQRSK